MESWKEFINKKIKILYDDGGSYPRKKEGILEKETETHLILRINNKLQGILLSKILRVEEMEE